MTKKILIPIAEGVEEIETITQIDVLRRAGAELTVAAVDTLRITASRGVIIVADKLIIDCTKETWDLISLPGGTLGAENLRDSKILIDLLRRQKKQNRLFGAICASPALVFYHHGLLEGIASSTCYPTYASQLPNHSNDRVVVDKNCITGQGPGTSLEYSLKLVELLFGNQKVKELKEAMVVN